MSADVTAIFWRRHAACPCRVKPGSCANSVFFDCECEPICQWVVHTVLDELADSLHVESCDCGKGATQDCQDFRAACRKRR